MAGSKEKGKTLTEMQQQAENVDLGVYRDYMTVMSNTLSDEDFAKIQEEGYDFSNADPETAVTIVDKMKAEMARSGQHIVGYTDDLDEEMLAAAVGSATLATAISNSFQEADIPLTRENLTNVRKAWEMASQLTEPGDGELYYMIDNELMPQIWNLYLAGSSGAESMTGTLPKYYAEEIQGYYTQSATAGMEEGLQEQLDKVIEEAGLASDEESHQWAEWLLEKGLPITEENLLKLRDLQKISYPVTEEKFAQAAATAIAEGKLPIHADLVQEENLYQKASSLTETYYSEKLASLREDDIVARRQLEEIRLRMTAEVNVKLLKSGFSIDTAPMEAMLEELKKVEAQLAESYFPKDTQAIEKYALYQQTNQVVEELPQMPARIIGSWTFREEPGTVSDFHTEGKALQETYAKAQESYETLMTTPRKDMGDSIQKAFSNVDDILEDMHLEINEENQRAVRILGYNSMEITVDNIEKVQAVDERVRSVVQKMTPGATLQMIRDGVNPLEIGFEELSNYFDNQSGSYEESAESYSRFLYQLEQNQEITPKERESYIGVYRLLRQIEKSDGAVVGAVVNSNMELQFANLLAAVRSNRFSHMDVKITDETGFVKELIREGRSISEQISEAILQRGAGANQTGLRCGCGGSDPSERRRHVCQCGKSFGSTGIVIRFCGSL